MLTSEMLLLLLSLMGIILSPLYLFLRGKMTKSNKPHEYSKKTIFRVVGMHFLMMFGITAIQVVILQSLLMGTGTLTQKAIFVVSVQILFLAAALYGSGIYITAILFETFVTKKYLVIRFLHGPLSHTIIYGAYLGTFGNLSFIANELGVSSTTAFWQLFILLGVLAGIVAAIDNYANGILILSLLCGLIALLLFTVLNTQLNAFSYFFLGLLGGFLTVSCIFIAARLLQGKKLSWYEPVNIF